MPLPDLPASWPYAPRGSLSPLVARPSVDIPGLGDGWTLHAPGGFEVPAGAAPLEGAFGRGGILRAGDVVVRPYRRGGLLRHLNRRRYASPARFLRELEIHRALWERGFPTVEPLGCAHRSLGAGCEGLFLTRFREARPWPAAWERDPQTLAALGRALRALADWGLLAPDLNATNVLLEPAGGLLCLDWDRAAFGEPGDGLAVRYLRRMAASLRRLGAPEDLLPALRRALEEAGG